MNTLMRGCTPSIRFTFPTVTIPSMAACYLIVKSGQTVIEKHLDDCEKGENFLTWKLTQEDTLSIKENEIVQIQVRYKLSDGTVGASRIYTTTGKAVLKDGVI